MEDNEEIILDDNFGFTSDNEGYGSKGGDKLDS